MKKVIIILFGFLPLTMGTSSCEISEACKTALCDLVTTIGVATGSSAIIPAGGVMTFFNIIQNVSDVKSDCGTEISKLTHTNIKLSFKDMKKSTNDTHTVVYENDNNPIEGINPDKKSEETYQVTFNEPGDYILLTNADNRKEAEERDETNNISPELQGIGSKKSLSTTKQYGMRITVLPNPNFKKSAHTQQVEVERTNVRIID